MPYINLFAVRFAVFASMLCLNLVLVFDSSDIICDSITCETLNTSGGQEAFFLFFFFFSLSLGDGGSIS